MTDRPQPDHLDPDVCRLVDGVAIALAFTGLAIGLVILALGCIARWAL